MVDPVVRRSFQPLQQQVGKLMNCYGKKKNWLCPLVDTRWAPFIRPLKRVTTPLTTIVGAHLVGMLTTA